jgi:hypothetical protein
MMKNNRLAILFALCLGVFISATAFGQDNSKDILKKIQELDKKAQESLDVNEIENLMGIHAMQNKGAVKAGDKDYVETVAQKVKDVCYGRDDKYVYGDAARKALHGLDDPTFGKAGTLKMHMVTTGYIQIAEDGKTAKAIWYSPGILTEIGTDGKPKSAWDFKKYGVDYVKEDGKWRIWHLIAYTDFTTPPNALWTEKVTVTNTAAIKYQEWTADKTEDRTKAPVAYKTFSETFSYCPAEGSNK